MNRGTQRGQPFGVRTLAISAVVMLLVAGPIAMVAISRPVAAADFSIGDTAIVDADELNLRAEPTIEADVVAELTAGTIGVVTDGPVAADDYNWYQIELDDGTIGWAAGDLMSLLGAIDPGFAPGDTVSVIVGSLNLRADATIEADILTPLEAGTVVTVIDGPFTVDGLPWYQIDAGELGTGWSAGGFLSFSGEAPTTTTGSTTTTGLAIGAAVAVDADALNLRDAAGLDGGVIDLLPFGARATIVDGPVTADDLDWYQIETELGTGWSAGDFLVDPASLIAVGDTVQVVDGDLNFRADATLDAEVLDVLPDATELSVTDGPVDADGYIWFAVTSADFGDGWVAGQFLTVVSTTDTAETATETEATEEETAADDETSEDETTDAGTTAAAEVEANSTPASEAEEES